MPSQHDVARPIGVVEDGDLVIDHAFWNSAVVAVMDDVEVDRDPRFRDFLGKARIEQPEPRP
jgi:hypothetical protein